MLAELRVANFALIEQLRLTFPSGFVALTGETGAGKSLIVDALALLLGQRATAEQIRLGADEAELEAAFTFSPQHPLLASLRGGDLLGQGETDVILRRILSRSGRGRSYVNGRLVSLQELEGFAGLLVDIHGQHDQQSLLRPLSQLNALDHFSGLTHLREQYFRAYSEWKKSKQRYEETASESARLQEREDLLRYQAGEIGQAALQPGEEQTLQERCRRLDHADRLRLVAEEAYGVLYAGDEAALVRLGLVARNLRELTAIDRGVDPWNEQLDHAIVLLQDLAAGLRQYRDGIEDDPTQLAEVQARLAKLDALKRKYGGTLEAVIAKGEELREQVARLERVHEQGAVLKQEVETRFQHARALAVELSTKRRKASGKFEAALQKEFRALHLAQARAAIQVGSLDDPEGLTPTGADRIEFLFSGNAGEALYPLARVASGGECSRVMLALKTVLAEHDIVPVLVFDEIDAGVGGSVATAVGTRLRNLSRFHQVLCVTHAPQVAAKAHAQIEVEKSAHAERTVTSARQLSAGDRQDSIARMLGGQTVTPTMRRAAAELLRHRDPA